MKLNRKLYFQLFSVLFCNETSTVHLFLPDLCDKLNLLNAFPIVRFPVSVQYLFNTIFCYNLINSYIFNNINSYIFIKQKFFRFKKGCDCIPNLFLITPCKTNCEKNYFYIFLFKPLQNFCWFLRTKQVSWNGHFPYLFLRLDFYNIALLNSFFIKRLQHVNEALF